MASKICPRCGGKKSRGASLCHQCVAAVPDWSAVPHDWLAQFVGVFLTRGHVGARLTPKGELSLTLVVKALAEERVALEAIQAQLGGRLRPEGVHRIAWHVHSQPVVRSIVAAMTLLVRIPFAKARQFEVVAEYFAWRDQLGDGELDRRRILEYQRRLQELRKTRT